MTLHEVSVLKARMDIESPIRVMVRDGQVTSIILLNVDENTDLIEIMKVRDLAWLAGVTPMKQHWFRWVTRYGIKPYFREMAL